MNIHKIQSFFGYLAAALMIPLALVSLMGIGPISEALVKISGVKISPWFTGGEVRMVIEHGTYQTRVHRPVFDGLFTERREGFVQLVWAPGENLPETIEEAIDYDSDGQADFQVILHPQAKTAQWKAYQPSVLGMQGPYQIGDGIGVRVSLSNP